MKRAWLSFLLYVSHPALIMLWVLLVFAGLVVGITAVAVQVDQAGCARVASQSSYETKFVGGTYFTRECYVRQEDGRWVPLDKWRGIDE